MATKKEVWLDDQYDEHEREVEALFADLENAICADDKSRMVAAIDALHEYAHRGDKASNAHKPLHYPPGVRGFSAKPEASTTVLPEGVPTELDDWVKRWDWITARVTEDAIRGLRKGDEVRIGLHWYRVAKAYSASINLDLGDAPEVTNLTHVEALHVINEVRYNGR